MFEQGSMTMIRSKVKTTSVVLRVKSMSQMFIFVHKGSTVPTQNIQRALVVGDDDIGSLCLQMLPTAHFKSKTQEILHVTDHEADNPERKKVNYSPE